MPDAAKILTLILPIFGLIGLGYLGGKRGLLKGDASDSLSSYVFYFAFPALLFNITSKTPIGDFADRNLIIAYSLAMVVMAVIVAMLTRRNDGVSRGMMVLTAIFGNVAYIGIPWNTVAFGEKSQSITALTIAITLGLTVFWSLFLGQGAMFAAGARALGILRLPVSLAKKFLQNPMIVAIAAGLACSALKVELPQALSGILEMLADTAGPTALFALGAFFVGKTLGKTRRGALVGLIAAKLIALPVLTLLAFKAFPVDPMKAAISITQAAMPMAATNFIFAKRYDADPELIGGAIVASTLVSAVTLPILLLTLS